MIKYAVCLTYPRLRYYKSEDQRPAPINSHGQSYLRLNYTDSRLAIF